MVGQDSDPQPTRPPTEEDLKRLCSALNAAGAKYLVIGGFAVNYYGFARGTEDLDLLIASDPDDEAISRVGAHRDAPSSDRRAVHEPPLRQTDEGRGRRGP